MKTDKKAKFSPDRIPLLYGNGKIAEFNENELTERIQDLKKCIGLNFKYCLSLFEECYHYKKITQKEFLSLLNYSKYSYERHSKSGNFTIDFLIRACFIFGFNPSYILLGENQANNYQPLISMDDYQYLTFKSRKDRIFDELGKLFNLKQKELSTLKEFMNEMLNHPEREHLKGNLESLYKNNLPAKNPLYTVKDDTQIKIKNELIKKYRKKLKNKILKDIDDITQKTGKNKKPRANCYIDKDGVIHKAKTHEKIGYFSLLDYEDDYCYDFNNESRKK